MSSKNNYAFFWKKILWVWPVISLGDVIWHLNMFSESKMWLMEFQKFQAYFGTTCQWYILKLSVLFCKRFCCNCVILAVFLLRQLRIVNYYIKKLLYNLSDENRNTGVSVVSKTKCELHCQNELFLKYHFSGKSVFSTEIVWRTIDVIIDGP